MEIDKLKLREAKRQIRKILLEYWDPIGVNDVPEAQDEYDNYLGKIFSMLETKASEDELISHLYWIETDHMGLTSRSKEAIKPIVQKLLLIDANVKKN